MVTSNQLNTLLDELIDLWIYSQISTNDFIDRCNSKTSVIPEDSESIVVLHEKILSINLLLDQQQSLDNLVQRRPHFVNYCPKIERDGHNQIEREKTLKREIKLKKELKLQRERDLERKRQLERDRQLDLARRLQEERQYKLDRQQHFLRKQELDRKDKIKWEQDKRREEERALRQLEWQRQREVERLRQVEPERLRLLQNFETNYVDTIERISQDSFSSILSKIEIEDIKQQFVREWVTRELNLDFDNEQASAIGEVNGNIKVTARAGSGKTRTIVARTVFLIKHCKTPPDALLLLAFNKKAADELRLRLKEYLGDEIPHVMTFHALAYSIVQPMEKLISDDPSSESQELSRIIQKLVDDNTHSVGIKERIRTLMLSYFRTDWNRIIEKEFDLNAKNQLIALRSLTSETLKGDFVKSYGEKIIANALFENDIEYTYEESFKWNESNYRPDFSIRLPSGGGIAIEYFGLTGQPEYDLQSQQKREYWKQKQGWVLVERSQHDVIVEIDVFVTALIQDLKNVGIKSNSLTDDEIWRRIKPRAIGRFTLSMRSFISRCRKLGLSSQGLKSLIDNHQHESDAEKKFLILGDVLYKSYLEYLKVNSKEDFDGLISRATVLLRENKTTFDYKKNTKHGDLHQIQHLMIDEFQDFSILFYQLIQQIKALNSEKSIFCVGDDWQAINGFAGSDLKYFENFGDYFRDGYTKHISTNYRSPRSIVELGNWIMRDQGLSAKPNKIEMGETIVAYVDNFSPTEFEKKDHRNDKLVPLLLRIIHKFANEDKKLALLFRTNEISMSNQLRQEIEDKHEKSAFEKYKKYLNKCLGIIDNSKITISTTHKFKGLESDVVIIVDALEDKYPIVHPTWQFLRIFGENLRTIYAENRRLFYVAATRATHSLVIISDSRKPSPFLLDYQGMTPLEEVKWKEIPSLNSRNTDEYEISVFFAFDAKEELKKIGYKWNAGERCWSLLIPAKNWSENYFNQQSWVKNVGTIRVKSRDNATIYLKKRTIVL